MYVCLDDRNLISFSSEEKLFSNMVEFNPTKSLDSYIYEDGNFRELTEEEKEEYYGKEEKLDKSEEIKSVLNTMVLAVLPEGETLTKENAPSLVDIINPAKQEDAGTLENPIEIIDNDIAHNGYLYTYGKYYKWNGVIYLCTRQGETTGNTIKLFYTPDQLIGHYFNVV